MMTDKWIQVAPKDVVWANIDVRCSFLSFLPSYIALSLRSSRLRALMCYGAVLICIPPFLSQDGAYETRARYVTSWIASVAVIVLWFAPVAFVGLLSNVGELCAKVKCVARLPSPSFIRTLRFKA